VAGDVAQYVDAPRKLYWQERVWPLARLCAIHCVGVCIEGLSLLLCVHALCVGATLQILGLLVLVVANSTMEPFLQWVTHSTNAPIILTAALASVLFMVR
jgi:hypothetical protein